MIIEDLVELAKNECEITLGSLLNTIGVPTAKTFLLYRNSISFLSGIHGAYFLFYEDEERFKIFVVCPNKVQCEINRENTDKVIIVKISSGSRILFNNLKYCKLM